MESNVLTSIERELVLQYLIDGNVPVTVIPVKKELESTEDNAIRPPISTIFPIAIKGEQLNVLKEGIIHLSNPPKSVEKFKTQEVRVEFYFNRLGLYFNTQLKEVTNGLALVIPSSIYRISDIETEKKYDFSVRLFYSCNDKSDVHIKCFPLENYRLFSKPIWADVPEEIHHKAKNILEEIVLHAKKQGTCGNGLQLIPVCRYLASNIKKTSSVQGRSNPLDIIYADYERIVFASDVESMHLDLSNEYALEMSFSLEVPALKTRTIFLTCFVEALYKDEEENFVCAVCKYTSIKEEDLRFLYEKTTNKIYY